MSAIHDRKDQLINSLFAFQATFWVGLFSVGFWNCSSELAKAGFCLLMLASTFSLILLFLSILSCFYYPKYLVQTDMFKDPSKKVKAENRANLWKRPWNWHWIAFAFGGGVNIVALSVRIIFQ